jgi:hypothetical protein
LAALLTQYRRSVDPITAGGQNRGAQAARSQGMAELVQKIIKGQFQVPEKFGIAPVEIWRNVLAA